MSHSHRIGLRNCPNCALDALKSALAEHRGSEKVKNVLDEIKKLIDSEKHDSKDSELEDEENELELGQIEAQ